MSMNMEVVSPIDLSTEAALELEELLQGKRDAAPALVNLFHMIKTPVPSYSGKGLSMLADIRSYAVFRDSLDPSQRQQTSVDFDEFTRFVEQYLDNLKAGVASGEREKIKEAKKFCISLNTNLVSNEMAEIYNFRENADLKFVIYDAVS